MSAVDRGLIIAQPSWQHLHHHVVTVSALGASTTAGETSALTESRRSSSHDVGHHQQPGGQLVQFHAGSRSDSDSSGGSTTANIPPSQPRRAASGILVQPSGGSDFATAIEGPLSRVLIASDPFHSPSLSPPPSFLTGTSPAAPLVASSRSGSLYRSGLSGSTETTTKSSSSSGAHNPIVAQSHPANDGLVYRLLGSLHYPRHSSEGEGGGSHFYFSEPHADPRGGAPSGPPGTAGTTAEEVPGRREAV